MRLKLPRRWGKNRAQYGRLTEEPETIQDCARIDGALVRIWDIIGWFWDI